MDHSYACSSRPEATSTLQALCRQEESTYLVTGHYLATECTDLKVSRRRAKCRSAMVTWFITVVDYLEFERETVSIGLNYLDRFLETPQGQTCLTTPRRFKIAGMTCLYTAIKAHEPEAIEPDLVVELSGNLCEVADIEAMERTILTALEWRVNPPTALSFCRQLLGLVPRGAVEDPASLLDLAQVQTELAVSDARLVTTPPSILAMASIFNALESSKHAKVETLHNLSSLFFVALASSPTLEMDTVFDVQDILDDIIRQHNQPDDNGNDENDDTSDQQHQEQEELAESSPRQNKNDADDEDTASGTPEDDLDVDSAASPVTLAKEMALSLSPPPSTKNPAVLPSHLATSAA
jgi:Cyclin, N-terminal domain/Cyclin, C-terminal domain